jgi:FtsP/CotA-like multicopper oxidase with cupredoxin domain
MLIHGPKHADYDVDVGPVILSDWYHDDYYTIVQGTMHSTTGLPPPSNNNLINGKMNYPCANTTAPCVPNAGLSKFFFKKGKKYLLRLINTSADGMQKFSIDGHKLTVTTQDFTPIVPFTTNVVTLGIAQRADVIVEAVGDSNTAYWMRSQLGTPGPTCCSLPDGVSPNALAVVYYENAGDTAVPTTTTDVTDAQILDCGNDPLTKTVPLYTDCAKTNGSVTTQELDINITNNGTAFVWTVNNSTFRGDYNDALLLDANKGNLNPKPEWNVYDFKSAGTIRLVIYNQFPLISHPMHMHGHNMQILAEGFGKWDGTITNPSNPMRRDTQLLRQASTTLGPAYIVVQFNTDNPGVWPLHCHIASHVSAGLYINVVEQTSLIKNYQIPDALAQTCKDWAAFTSVEVPDQIDSGL